ncbi:hypothetical protein Lal_00044084 [Lupinus albus]|nr:hypothetical protein Lal_00044084 [Lupinus albus]
MIGHIRQNKIRNEFIDVATRFSVGRPALRLRERRTRFLPLPIDLESPLRFLRGSELGSRLRIGEGISTPSARIQTFRDGTGRRPLSYFQRI